MKKIISALAVSALALGSVFAADVSLEYTQKGMISNNEGGKSVKLDLNGYAADVTGDVIFSVSNDNAGVLVDIDPWYDDTARKGVQGATQLFDEYYGWVKFFDGKMKLQSGVWGDRTVNRMTQDKGKWENGEYEKFKPGVINGAIGADISKFAAFNGETSLTTALTYDDGTFSVTAGAITSTFKTSTSTTGTTTTKSGFGFNLAYNIDEDTKITAILKTPTDQSVAFAAFVDKKGFEIFDRTFDVMAGATVAGRDSSNTSDYNGFEGAVDLRFRYEISDTVALTSMNNFSYNGNLTTSGSSGEALKSIWNMLSVAVQATDTIKVQLTGEWYYADLDAENAGLLEIIPGVTYSPVEGTSLTGGIIIKTEGWKNPSESSIAIPFVLSVAL